MLQGPTMRETNGAEHARQRLSVRAHGCARHGEVHERGAEEEKRGANRSNSLAGEECRHEECEAEEGEFEEEEKEEYHNRRALFVEKRRRHGDDEEALNREDGGVDNQPGEDLQML